MSYITKELLLNALEQLRRVLDPENKFIIKIISNHKRSLNANSYMWVLADKIAKVIKSSREDVYKTAIKEVGVYDDMAVVSAASERFVKNWNEKGVGWFAESFGESKVKGADRVRVYYGSSIYDKAEMARLIDYIVQEANNLHIETLTPAELERLKNNWRNQ